MPYRFVHTADIHLDSPLKSLALRDPEIAELIGNATRRAFTNIIELCLAEQVDALLLAGDLYDGDQTSMKTARFLADQIRRLHAAGIQVFIVRGNHDALAKISKELEFPDTVKVFGGRAEAVRATARACAQDVFVHGISFANQHAPESLLPKYKPPVGGAINIALMHTSLDGSPGHDRYAPCRSAELDQAGFEYWALGHIHKRSVLRNKSTIVMPGMPQGRDINEAGAKSATLVTIMDDRSVHVEERVTGVAQFERLHVDLTGAGQWRDMLRALSNGLEVLRAHSPSEHLVIRPCFSGVTPLAWRLRRDADLVKTEAADKAFAAAPGKYWIEAIEIDCVAPDPVADPSSDPLTELRRLVRTEVVTSEAFRLEASSIAEELRGQLPVDARAFLGLDESEFETTMTAIIRDGTEDVLARLHPRAAAKPNGDTDDASAPS